MSREEEVKRYAALMVEEGEEYRYPAAIGIIKATVTGDQSPFAKLRRIENVLKALDLVYKQIVDRRDWVTVLEHKGRKVQVLNGAGAGDPLGYRIEPPLPQTVMLEGLIYYDTVDLAIESINESA
ncbi:hypothetical protein [Paenibacillus graminis]|uniref:hypothetical protein n=1 Tax=Paenibacillus graminis TaxID=189425 RepID=UPI002DBD4810|nr:hypothetical protein [Paenibacillus graminis]MEC0168145.1 hypothetical protein [Paenibacillus graminis]